MLNLKLVKEKMKDEDWIMRISFKGFLTKSPIMRYKLEMEKKKVYMIGKEQLKIVPWIEINSWNKEDITKI